MTIRYEYKSACCGHEYVEQRAEDKSAYVTTCNKCGSADYELISETPAE
jgi:peptide subunit release factor 1 (eRF1)